MTHEVILAGSRYALGAAFVPQGLIAKDFARFPCNKKSFGRTYV
jgi:hypothetical protein